MGDAPKPLPELKLEATSGGYFAREIAAPDAARDRAERAYTIAGAIGATLLGAGVIAGIGGESALVTILGVAALALWAIAAALFVQAVASPVERILPEHGVGRDEFADKAVELARSETAEIVRRYQRARLTSALAVVLTLAAIVAAAVQPGGRDRATLILTPQGAAAVAQACGGAAASASTRVRADVDLASLGADYVTVEPTAGDCPEIRLARDDVLAVAH